jgi:hypothetical protein
MSGLARSETGKTLDGTCGYRQRASGVRMRKRLWMLCLVLREGRSAEDYVVL